MGPLRLGQPDQPPEGAARLSETPSGVCVAGRGIDRLAQRGYGAQRQIEAAQAYSRGDQATAHHLIQQNIAALKGASMNAPAPMKASLAKQSSAYGAQMDSFAAAPSSDEGKRAAKSTAASESSNLARSAY